MIGDFFDFLEEATDVGLSVPLFFRIFAVLNISARFMLMQKKCDLTK
jgi:hypothetical protein